jgi:NTE family protein
LLPEGGVDLAPQITAMRRLFDRGWSRDPLWITAAQLDTGAPVVFGHPDYPETDVGTAMASSGAVPGVCAPVRVGEHRYVDGGMISATHLDPVADAAEDLDLVIVSSPLSMYTPMRGLLHAEIRRLRRRVPVVAVEPHGPARREMGWNPMDLARAPEVARSTVDTLLESMRGGRHRPLADLLQKEDSPWIDAPQ